MQGLFLQFLLQITPVINQFSVSFWKAYDDSNDLFFVALLFLHLQINEFPTSAYQHIYKDYNFHLSQPILQNSFQYPILNNIFYSFVPFSLLDKRLYSPYNKYISIDYHMRYTTCSNNEFSQSPFGVPRGCGLNSLRRVFLFLYISLYYTIHLIFTNIKN